MSFKNVILGSQSKNYTHNLSFDNNTTMEFGVLQPLLSQYMFPKSSIKVSAKQLVRLAPMPTPSFARMYLANFASFVKMSDVVPYHESLLSKIPFTNGSSLYSPVSLPYTSNHTLLYFLLRDSFVDFYEANTSSSTHYQLVTDESVEKSCVAAFLTAFDLGHISESSYLYPKFTWMRSFVKDVLYPSSVKQITPYSADFVLRLGPNSSGNYSIACFKFSASALRLRKILIGLGFSLSFSDKLKLSVAPLLAFFKAYYNRFGLTRDLPFETTSCFAVIKKIEGYSIDFTLSSSIPQVFVKFLDAELSECWYTDANSYIAAQRSQLVNNTPLRQLSTLRQQNGSFTAMGYPVGDNSKTVVPTLNLSSQGMFSQLSLDVLKRLTAFVNKDSVIGKRMSDWVRVHYGADVSNSLFEESSRINEWRTNIDIDDVFSTSDTADVGTKDKGEYLGAYAGKGSGFSQSGFTYRAPVHGFVFVMSCIVPVANTFQGLDPTLLGVDLDTIPQPEFDALGFEATPRSVFVGDNFVADSSGSSHFADTFGFVPRYSGFKVKKNIVNGDMYKGFFQTDLLPYFNDRLFYDSRLKSSILATDDSKGLITSVSADFTSNLVPNSSTEFQKVCRYGFMGDFNRLFYNDDVSSALPVAIDSFPSSDNFIVQSVFDVRVSNFLKPVQNSYDTIDEDVDNRTTSVSSN